jgi:hypothetical protein
VATQGETKALKNRHPEASNKLFLPNRLGRDIPTAHYPAVDIQNKLAVTGGLKVPPRWRFENVFSSAFGFSS